MSSLYSYSVSTYIPFIAQPAAFSKKKKNFAACKMEIVKTIIMLQHNIEKWTIPALKKPTAELLIILIVISTLPGINREEKNIKVCSPQRTTNSNMHEWIDWLEIPCSKDKLSLAVHYGNVALEKTAVHPRSIF